nr:hypothetical protein B0A51_02961 [Rachicladosporium sp. CCFEE 5018]
MEGCVSDLALSAEELVIQNERRRVRRARMHAASNKARYESERRRDINAWRAMENRKARAYIKANRSAARARGRRSKHKAIKDRRFLCVDCDEPNGSLHNLQRHQNGRPHRDQVAINAGELTAKAPTEKAVYQRDRIAAAKANKTYYCGVCRHNPGKPESLAGHKKSMKHNRRMKEAGLEPDYPEVLENDE